MATHELPHVLVVGDHPDITSEMCGLLASSPFRCTGATGHDEAFARVREENIAAALVDVSGLAPDEGLALARRLREHTEDLGVVLLATRRSLDDLIEALRLGVVDYLSRPIAGNELADAIQRAIEWRFAAQDSRGALARFEQEMAVGAARFAVVFRDAGIGSTIALESYLEQLYGANDAAFQHTRRVASAAVLIAENMHIGEPLLGHIERAAMLHDVGKLFIPKPILRTSWPLSAGEHALIRSHVRVAAEAVASIPYLAPTAEIIIATRERYDGCGYPRGLAGADIPLGARIVSVAEAFDTLHASPGAAEPRSTHAANAELVRAAGTMFDPHVIKVWLRCLDRFESHVHEGFES